MENETEVIIGELTPEQEAERAEWEAGQYQRDIDEVNSLRLYAYQTESDPIYFQAQREDTYTLDDWKAKVAEINDRYPYPAPPKTKKK